MTQTLKVKWPRVIDSSPYTNIDRRPLIRWIDLGNGTMFRVIAFFTIGTYEEPRPGFLVAIERAGCFLFAIPSQPLSGDYVSEKLTIPNSDGYAMADWMNAQCGFTEAKQQGEYNREYIEEVEPYGLGGENKIMPLVPEIIE